MARGEGKLQARACTQWVKGRADAIADAFGAAADLLTLEFENAADLTQGGAIQQTLDYLFRDPYAWVQFALGHAAAGTLIASAGDPVAWYVVTHKGPCAGARTTTTQSARKQAEALGVALAAPEIRARNPGLDASALRELERTLRSQGMRGLEPIVGAIVSGFKEGTRVWDDAQRESRGESPRRKVDVDVRAQRMARKFKRAKENDGGDAPAISAWLPIAVGVGAAAGWAVAGPPGALLGGVAGLIGNFGLQMIAGEQDATEETEA